MSDYIFQTDSQQISEIFGSFGEIEKYYFHHLMLIEVHSPHIVWAILGNLQLYSSTESVILVPYIFGMDRCQGFF